MRRWPRSPLVCSVVCPLVLVALSTSACTPHATTPPPLAHTPAPGPVVPAPKASPDAVAPKWDVADPPGAETDVAIDVREGTWMSLDISPDGKEISFDLLGDLYTLPIAGGEAKALTTGMA